MSDELAVHAHQHAAHVTVSPVVDAWPPYRRVEILGAPYGHAYQLADVIDLMRRAGLDDLHYEDPDLVDWQGGGPEVWE
jgi:hypothetical protein